MQPFSRTALRKGTVTVWCHPSSRIRLISFNRVVERGKRRQNLSAERFNSQPQNQPSREQQPSHGSSLGQEPLAAVKPKRHHGQGHIVTSIPYTTANSEFLYGNFAVLSALKSDRRSAYKLYVLSSSSTGAAATAADEDAPDEASHEVARRSILHLARLRHIEIKDVEGPQALRLFNKLSSNRPHGGMILEVSPLPKLRIDALCPLSSPKQDLQVIPARNPEQEDAEITRLFKFDQMRATIPSNRPPHRYPLVLLLDRITNPGNFGAIVRSAWFLGVDAIIIPDHGTSPVSPVSIKASAGALELMPVLTIKHERAFLTESRAADWKFFAAAAPVKGDHGKRPTLQLEGALSRHPCVLVFGNEKSGPRKFWDRYMHSTVSIPNARAQFGDIDSLNVSVAAALLTQKFIDSSDVEVQPPVGREMKKEESVPGASADPTSVIDSNRLFS